MRRFLTEFVVAFYNGVEERDEDVYTERDGEVLTEFFPHFPAVFEKAEYKIDNKGNTKEKSSQKDLCAKLFPKHQKLTSGLFIVTCSCMFLILSYCWGRFFMLIFS